MLLFLVDVFPELRALLLDCEHKLGQFDATLGPHFWVEPERTEGTILNGVGPRHFQRSPSGKRSERADAERELRVSEERYRRLFETAQDGILLLDGDSGLVIDVNPFLLQLLGYSRDELLGKELWELGPFTDKATSRAAFRQLQETGYVRYEDLPLQARSGELRRVEFVSNVYQVGDQRTIQCNIRDITERHRTAGLLKLQTAALEASASAMVITDTAGTILWVNPAFSTLTGYPRDEIVGRNTRVFKSGRQDAEFYRTLWTAILAGRVWRGEIINRRRDGSLYTEDQTITPVRSTGEDITHFIAIKQDVTEQKRATDALRASEERFRLTFDESGTGMTLQTTVGRYVRVNRAFGELLGYTADELLALNFRDVTHSEDREAGVEGDRQMLAGEFSYHQTEKRYLHRDGRVIWVLAGISLLRDRDGQPLHFLVQVQDITTRKRMETELEREREARLQSDKLAAMGQLLAGVAHELNNPLAVVLGRAALLRRALKDGPLAHGAEQIGLAAERCGRIVKNFLALARQYPSERDAVDLNGVVQEAVELLAYPLRLDSVQVVWDLGADLPTLWADGHQLHQVVINLITNAHYAMRQSAGPRQLTLTTRQDVARARLLLGVADTGPGIPPEVLPRLFEPFFTTKPPGQGTGLGLSLCRGFVEEHEGTITVESVPGQGARFRVELPLTVPGDVAPSPVDEARPVVRGQSILVVDDEAEVASVLAEILAIDEHRVEVAPNGKVALGRILEQPYDLVLSDMKMPELDGPGLYRRLEGLGHPVVKRIVFLTGDDLGPETRAFLAQTGAPRVSKPFTPGEIRQIVQQVLRARTDPAPPPSRGRTPSA
jgi:nitrogen fixation negative regulator NifL